MFGELEKLIIQAFEKEDFSGTAIDEFSAYVNPSEITHAYEMEYDSAQGSGTTGSRMEFKKVKPGDLSLNFFIDGTGANGDLIDVQDKISHFQKVTGYNGNIHRPNYLKVVWGTMPVKHCILKSASIAYKLFKPSGEPLRAIITASFSETTDDETRVAQAQDSSPDLTHLRTVKAGDTLPKMCYDIYGDSKYYLEVARANRLDNFRQLQPGTRLLFPPLDKSA